MKWCEYVKGNFVFSISTLKYDTTLNNQKSFECKTEDILQLLCFMVNSWVPSRVALPQMISYKKWALWIIIRKPLYAEQYDAAFNGLKGYIVKSGTELNWQMWSLDRTTFPFIFFPYNQINEYLYHSLPSGIVQTFRFCHLIDMIGDHVI